MRKVLVQLDCSDACDQRLEIANRLCLQHAAELRGLHFTTDSFHTKATSEKEAETQEKVSSISGQRIKKIKNSLAQQTKQIRNKITQHIDETIAVDFHTLLHATSDDLLHACTGQDILIVSDNVNFDQLLTKLGTSVVTIAMESQCLVCCLPSSAIMKNPFRSSLIILDTPEVHSKAFKTAMKLLKGTESVTLFCSPQAIDEKKQIARIACNIEKQLRKYGVTDSTIRQADVYPQCIDELRQVITSNSYDCIVIAAYDHNNVEQLIRGQALGAVIKASALPVLLFN